MAKGSRVAVIRCDIEDPEVKSFRDWFGRISGERNGSGNIAFGF
jgi:hypothetical protein